jgi:hypothetical protein
MSYWNYIPEAESAVGSLYAHAIMGHGAAAYTQENDQYDFSLNTWTSKTNTSMTARNPSTSVGVNEVIYVQGGYTGTPYSAHAKYTLGSDAWANLTSMVHNNHKKIGARMNDDYYITGGVSYGGNTAEALIRYNVVATDTWSTTGVNFNAVCAAGAGGSLDRTETSAIWYVCAGAGSTDKYTKATNAVTSLTNLSSPFDSDVDGRHTGFTAGGNLYVATGWEGDDGAEQFSKECREYSVSGNSWSTKTDCNNERTDCAGVSQAGDNDKGNVIGGGHNAYKGNLNEQYSVSGNTWTAKAVLLYDVQHVGGADA